MSILLSDIYYYMFQLFELGSDGGDNETDGEMIAETDLITYECGARYIFSIFPIS